MTQFENLERQTLSERVYHELRHAIMRGDLPEGSELNQVALAEQFNISRVPIREALGRLQGEQLVSATKHQRYIISRLAPAKVLELVELRLELEVLALRRRLEHLTDEDVEALRQAAAVVSAEKDGKRWLVADVEWHRLFNGPTTELSDIIANLRTRIRSYVSGIASMPTRREEASREHELIIEALAARDGERAEGLLRDHINRTRDALIEQVDKEQSGGGDPGAGAGRDTEGPP